MRLILAAVGRMKAGPEKELLHRYLGRARLGARGLGLSGVDEVEVDESHAGRADQRKGQEADAILAKIPGGSRVMVLDEHGRQSGSVDLARIVEAARDGGVPALCFVIGGPDGVAPRMLTTYDTLAFGRLTIPHQLVRVLVAEQIYRLITILAGHPYHRA